MYKRQGVFYCNKKSSKLLEPLSVGGESADSNKDGKLEYKEMPEKFQAGFRNYVGLAGMESSISYLQNLGLENIRKHIIKLSNLFIDEIWKMPESTIYVPEDESVRTSIVSFDIEKNNPVIVVSELAKKGIIIAKREIMDKPILRISPHVFNTEDEILRVIEAVSYTHLTLPTTTYV